MGKGQPGSLLGIQEILFQEPLELLGSLFPPILLVGKGLGWSGMDWDGVGCIGCAGLLGGRSGLAQARVKEVPILKYHPFIF